MLDYTDLLGRKPATIDETAVGEFLRGAAVLVTGGGGSIGSELCRQIQRFKVSRLGIVDRAEDNLFRVHRDVPSASTYIGDVCDKHRMEAICSLFRPEIVLHAAAYKHVPLMEENASEAIRNNVLGTRTIAEASAIFGARTFVMISTDKAVNPTSVMGATKRLAERYVRAIHGRSRTTFLTVRFGNVLGSAGSVVPIFLDQIERGGPVTVTHPDMERFFMLIPEACQLVLQAAALGRGGETFVLDMGQPIKILDLAKELIRRSGVTPEPEIIFTGVRPGEKLVEELSRDGLRPTTHPGVLVGHLPGERLEDVVAVINELSAAVNVRARLMEAA